MDTRSSDWLERQAQLSLDRLLPRLRGRFAGADAAHWQAFQTRLAAHFPRLFGLLVQLYGSHYDFFYHLERILETAAGMWLDRPADLKALDAVREADRSWFQSEKMLGGVCYVDLFGGSLAGIRAKLPYFKELGLTYVHLMPLFACPAGENDGGYAVSSYRAVNPALGSLAELSAMAGEFRRAGTPALAPERSAGASVSLVVDFIFNHTSNEHDWACRALAGEAEYQDYYYMFPDRTMPDAYERDLQHVLHRPF